MRSQFSNGYALVIGVANYPNVRKLPVQVLDDARDIAALLQSAEYCGYPARNVEQLFDGQATAAGIRAGLTRLARAAGADNTAIVFFSGHGGRVDSGPDAGAYLIPFDCYPGKLKKTAISADELTELLSAIPAGRLVIFLDACHAAGAGEVKAVDLAVGLKAGLDEKTYAPLAQGTGRVIMASSRSTELSLILGGMRNSLFTHCLLEALRGASATRGDGLVRVFDVFHYVSDRVPAQASQHPIFKAHDLENNFPLALDRGGTKRVPSMAEPGLAARPEKLVGKARIDIRKGLVTRWVDLADYFEVPLDDRDRFSRADSPPGKLLDWLEERRMFTALRDALRYLGMDDLIEVLDSHPL